MKHGDSIPVKAEREDRSMGVERVVVGREVPDVSEDQDSRLQ